MLDLLCISVIVLYQISLQIIGLLRWVEFGSQDSSNTTILSGDKAIVSYNPPGCS